MSSDEQRQRVIGILKTILNGEMDIIDGCRQLATLHNQGCDLVPIEFVGYDSEMDCIPLPEFRHLWNQEALERLLHNNPYKESVLKSAENLLRLLIKDVL